MALGNVAQRGRTSQRPYTDVPVAVQGKLRERSQEPVKEGSRHGHIQSSRLYIYLMYIFLLLLLGIIPQTSQKTEKGRRKKKETAWVMNECTSLCT